MKRPWQIWLVFGCCLAVVLAAMGWVSLMAVRAESDRQRFVTLEENVRLALWRMDSALAPLVAQESALPPAAYRAFTTETAGGKASADSLLVPSPLLTERTQYVLLHFQIDADGRVSSPQVPDEQTQQLLPTPPVTPEELAAAGQRLTEIAGSVDYATWFAQLPAPPETPPGPPPVVIAQNDVPPPNVPPQTQQRKTPYGQQGVQSNTSQQAETAQADPYPQQAAQLVADQRNRGLQEFNFRSQAVQLNAESYIGNNAFVYPPLGGQDGIGRMAPFWLDGRLLLARRVHAAGQELIQGCQLDWPALQQWLLQSVSDLFPEAELNAVQPPDLSDQSRLLAALPVRLTPGPMAPLPEGAATTLALPLLVAWTGVLLAAGAVAALLWGVVRLSERRGAFVSAVTHELRTPLTTFRMYAEMLAEDMVPDAERRRGYLETLRVEADRLSHLVENVLSYARLERTNVRGRQSDVPVAELLDRVRRRLSDRAGGAGLTLAIDADNGAAQLHAKTDAAAVEQVLFNLVDNACKYAADADPPTIHLEVDGTPSSVVIRVRDHGPGVSVTDSRRLFRPFSKSAREAAHTAPGVGLGLALSRRLARDTGGDLTLSPSNGAGACFILTLPRAG